MYRLTIAASLTLALTLPFASSGCGSGSDSEFFDSCGNGIVEGREECDDGNLNDQDLCLATCVLAQCNDQFVNFGADGTPGTPDDVEDCDLENLANQSCTTLGLGPGTLTCSNTCVFDVSDCGDPVGTPGTPTPMATPTGPQPTATPGPPGETCIAGDMIRVEVDLDSQGVNMAGASVRLDYPIDAVEIPGSMNDASVGERVEFLVDAPFQSVNDQDTPPEDSIDDRLNMSANGVAPFAPGPFANVDFDCIPGAPVPTVDDFICDADASDAFGGEITANCLLNIP